VNPGSPVDTSYSYNSGGGAITYTGTAGVYTVRMAELGLSGGSVQVSSYGSAATRCKVAGWGPSAGAQVIQVRCHDTSGALAASPFVVFFDKGSSQSGGHGAHLYYSGSTVPATWSWNSSGSTNTVTRTSTGRYNVSLPGLGFSNAGVHVTAYGSGSEHCKIVSWSTGFVNVRCNDNAGQLADSPFVLNYFSGTQRAYAVGGHAWIESASAAPAGYQSNQDIYSCGTAGPVTVSGFTNVTYPNTRPTSWSFPTTTMSKAYGDDGNFCKVQYWTPSGTGYMARTICSAPNGTSTTSRFTSSFMGGWAAPC
jgi:hypothetical protein